MKKILILSYLLSYSANIFAKPVDVMIYSDCPIELTAGLFLDGGSTRLTATTSGGEKLYFGLQNPSELSVANSSKTLTIKEKKYIEKNKRIKVYVNASSPNKKNVKSLPYKGIEENKLIDKLKTWLGCNSLSEIEKGEIRAFIASLSETRIREVVYEFDTEDKKLEEWREENSPTNVIEGNLKDEYLIISAYILESKKIDKPPIRKNKYDSDKSWYLHKLKVIRSFDKQEFGEEINVLQHWYKLPDINKETLGVFVLSEIRSQKKRNELGAGYYVHEVSEPEKIYCFWNDIKEISQIKNELYDEINARQAGRWNRQCISKIELDENTSQFKNKESDKKILEN